MTKTMTDTEIAAIIKEVDSSLGLVKFAESMNFR